MKKTGSRIITISDIVQWYNKRELELSPKYQRNTVWNYNAKSYLIDTIVRGLPIPPIFMRQQVDVCTKSTHREVIDGQQRIRAIIEYVVSESFAIKSSHNKALGGKHYSDLDEDMQSDILEYEIQAEIVTEKDDSVIYDMFARLNSNNYVLNKQEIRNAKYWGEFKVLAYRISSHYRDFFIKQNIFGDKELSRMKDVELINSMIIFMIDGIVKETPSIVDNYYGKYDKVFDEEDSINNNINKVMNILASIYDYFNGETSYFGNKNYFFTLFCTIANQMFGIRNENLQRNPQYSVANIIANIDKLNESLSNFISDLDAGVRDKENTLGNHEAFMQFIGDHKVRTTSKTERTRRIRFLNDALLGNVQ